MPAAETHISSALVRSLLAAQHEDLARLPLRRLAFGWDNVSYRLGDKYVVRLPRRATAAELVCNEQRWLPELAPRLPLPVPTPLRVGGPALGYPWPWSVVPWLPGRSAVRARPADAAAEAHRLGRFLGRLHAPAPPDHPRNPVRGIPLAARAEMTSTHIAALDGMVDVAAVRRRWRGALEAQPWPAPPRWLHGDLHAGNVLVHEGRISAVIDFGDITAGDPATDLAAAWMVFPRDARSAFRDGYCTIPGAVVDDDTWTRARGWALAIAVAILSRSADNPAMGVAATRTLSAVLADD